MSFVSNIFKALTGGGSSSPSPAPAAPFQAPTPVAQVADNSAAMIAKNNNRRRSGTQTKFGGVLDSSVQAAAAKKTLLGE